LVVNPTAADHIQAIRSLRNFETALALSINLAPDSDIERIAEIEQKLVATMHRNYPLADKRNLRLRNCVE